MRIRRAGRFWCDKRALEFSLRAVMPEFDLRPVIPKSCPPGTWADVIFVLTDVLYPRLFRFDRRCVPLAQALKINTVL